MYSDAEVKHWLDRMADQLRQQILSSTKDAAIVGIYTDGVRIAQELHNRLNLATRLGTLDISFYRDDFTSIGLHPQVKRSDIPFPVEGQVVILVDDVVYSGRTVRAALNTLFDYGRPARVALATLVERHGHELPIRADVKGMSIELATSQQIKINRHDLGLRVIQNPNL